MTATTTVNAQTLALNGGIGEDQHGFPSKLEDDLISKFPKLSREQAGHLRHFHNLANQRDGDWHHMGTQEPGQEWLDAYRYQLAVMAYASATTHYHRLPVLRSVFRDLMLKLIHKMLLRDVWGYWFLTSHSGKFVDPDITELRKPWADPVVKENIMYSGHFLLMVSLYTMLFDDDRFNQQDALEFNWNPIFWGMGPERFTYTRESLQAAILREMERENWLGVCCEPNNIFIVCNQFPLIALRYNDLRDGTNLSQYATQKYEQAWKAKGMFQEDGLFISWYYAKQDRMQASTDIGFTSWAVAYMNAWNPSVARQTFDTLAVGHLAKLNEREIVLCDPEVASQIRDFVASEGADAMDPPVYERACRVVASKEWPPELKIPFQAPLLGYVMQWVSEVGDEATLNGLFAHVEASLKPTWERGGLFYAPKESKSDSEPGVDRFTGNAGIAYGRLNTFDGQRTMYEKPWADQHFSSTPFVENVDLSSDVDFLRANWDEELQMLVLSMKSWDGQVKRIRPSFSGFAKGHYAIYKSGELAMTRKISSRSESFELDLEVSGEETSIVILGGQ